MPLTHFQRNEPAEAAAPPAAAPPAAAPPPAAAVSGFRVTVLPLISLLTSEDFIVAVRAPSVPTATLATYLPLMSVEPAIPAAALVVGHAPLSA